MRLVIFFVLMSYSLCGIWAENLFETFKIFEPEDEPGAKPQLIKDLIQSEAFDHLVLISAKPEEDMVFKMPLNTWLINSSVTLTILEFNLVFKEYMDWSYMEYEKQVCDTEGVFDSKTLTDLVELEMKNNKLTLFLILESRAVRASQFANLVFLLKNINENTRIAIIYDRPMNRWGIPRPFQNRHNIFLFHLTANDDQVYEIFEVCPQMLCQTDEGVLGVNLANTWNFLSGFAHPIQFSYNFDGNFRNERLYLRSQLHPSAVWISGKKNVGGECTAEFEGPLLEDYMIMESMLNFRMVFNEQKPDKCVHDQVESGVFRAVGDVSSTSPEILDLRNNDVDIVGGTLLGNYDTYQVADISAPTFYQSGANLVTVEPFKGLRPDAVIRAFKWYIWLLVLFCIPLSGALLFFMNKYGSMKHQRLSKKEAVWQIVKITCWENLEVSNLTGSMCIFLSAFWIAMFLLVTEYVGSFTSLVTVQTHQKDPIDTEDQLWESDMMWISGIMTDYYVDYFSYVENLELRLLHLRYKSDPPEIKSALELLISNPDKYAYFEKRSLVEWAVCNYDIDLQNRNLYYSEETIGNYFTYFYFRKAYPYAERINRIILHLHDTGLINMNHRKFINEESKAKCHQGEEEDDEFIRLEHFLTSCILLGVGSCLGLACFLCEVMRKRKMKKTD